MSNKVKGLSIKKKKKNHEYYFFNDIINFKKC